MILRNQFKPTFPKNIPKGGWETKFPEWRKSFNYTKRLYYSFLQLLIRICKDCCLSKRFGLHYCCTVFMVYFNFYISTLSGVFSLLSIA